MVFDRGKLAAVASRNDLAMTGKSLRTAREMWIAKLSAWESVSREVLGCIFLRGGLIRARANGITLYAEKKTSMPTLAVNLLKVRRCD